MANKEWFVSNEANKTTRKIHSDVNCADLDHDRNIIKFNNIIEANKEAPSGLCKKCGK